jgi:predicted GIY-YIG superfamily endonuclease
MFFVYILQSEFDNSFYIGSFYIGYTKDVFERLKGHNNGKTPFYIGYTKDIQRQKKRKKFHGNWFIMKSSKLNLMPSKERIS